MNTYKDLKQQVLNLFENTIDFANKYQWDSISKQLEKARVRLSESKFFIVVCGEFKQGKSSLLNAFLSENGLFPTDVDIATNLISTISYAQSEQITVLLEEGRKKKQISRAEIQDYVTEQQNTDNTLRADFLTIEGPYSQLKDGLVLVDTPGIGSLNTAHTTLTCGFIHHADLILFISDAQAPLSSIELNFVKERVTPYCRNVIFIVTKTDAVINYKEIVENNRHKLSEVLKLSPAEISIIPISSRAKIDYINSQDSEDLEDSNFKTLESTIDNLLHQQREQILLLHALMELKKALIGMKNPVQSELEAYKQSNKQELEKLECQFQEAQKQRQQLMENTSEWRVRLTDGLQDIRVQIQEKFQNGFVKIRRSVDSYLDNPQLLQHPEAIAGHIEADISEMVTVLSKELNAQAANLYGSLESLTGLDLNETEISSLIYKSSEHISKDIRTEKEGLIDQSFNVVKSATYNVSTGSMIGGILGGVVGGLGGFVLGGGVGAFPGATAGAQWGAGLGSIAGIGKGFKDFLLQTKEKTKREINKGISPFLEDSQRLCNQTLNRAVQELDRSMRDELTSSAKNQKESFERSLISIKEMSKLSQEQATKRAEELQLRLQHINQIQQRVEDSMKKCSPI